MQRKHWPLAAALTVVAPAYAQAPDFALIVDGEDAIAGERFLGGWQAAKIDCRTRTFRGVSFASLRENGVAGPELPIYTAPYPIAGGSAEAGMEAAVCDGAPPYAERASSVADAVRIGRTKLLE